MAGAKRDGVIEIKTAASKLGQLIKCPRSSLKIFTAVGKCAYTKLECKTNSSRSVEIEFALERSRCNAPGKINAVLGLLKDANSCKGHSWYAF